MQSKSLGILVAIAAVVAAPAHAVIEQPTVSPAAPTVRDTLTVRIRATGGCDGFYDLPNEAELIVKAPGQLQLIVDGVATLAGDPLCIQPDFTYRFELGSLAAGSYSLHVLVRDQYVLDRQLVSVGTVDFHVTSVFAIPGTSIWSIGVLALALACAGLGHPRART